MTRAKCSTSWSSDGAARDRQGDCCESYSRSSASHRSASPRISSNHTPSPSARNGFLPSMIRDCGRTIGRKIHTSRFDDERENNSGLKVRWISPTLPLGSRGCPERLLCPTPPAAAPPLQDISGRDVMTFGAAAALQSDPRCGAFRPTAAVNVSMLFRPKHHGERRMF